MGEYNNILIPADNDVKWVNFECPWCGSTWQCQVRNLKIIKWVIVCLARSALTSKCECQKRHDHIKWAN